MLPDSSLFNLYCRKNFCQIAESNPLFRLLRCFAEGYVSESECLGEKLGNPTLCLQIQAAVTRSCSFFFSVKIEVNNIAASMGGLSERATILHRRTLQDLGVSNEVITLALPDNRPVDTVARGIYEAW